MAQPTIAADATTANITTQTSHTVNLPTGSGAGTRTIMVVNANNNPGGNVITQPTGWTMVGQNQSAATEQSTAFMYIDGSHGATATVTLTNAEALVAYAARIENFNTGSAPEIGTWVTAENSATINPPSLDPSWGAEDVLWLSVLSWYYGGNAVTSGPSGYTLEDEVDNNTTAAGAVRLAYLGATADETEDPGIWTMPAADYMMTNTMAIRGTGGGGGVVTVFNFPEPALGGASVTIGDGTVRARHLNIPASEYATPFWIIPDSENSRAQRINSLPATVTLVCGSIAASSSEP